MAEQKLLESGIYSFPQDALNLKEAVKSRLRTIAKKDVNVRIVAEVAEIRNDRWRNAIEGYLHTQKYYVIVPQEFFREALRVFDKIKREKAVYGTGLVDIEKLKRLNPSVNAGSLAEEIETEDIDVRLFLDFTLGRVQKCDSVGELRRYRTSITDEGMLYQNFVVRAMHPERLSKPAIGGGAIQRRLDAVKKEIHILTEQIAVYASVKIGLDVVNTLVVLSNTEIESTVFSATNVIRIPDLKADLISLQKNREAIDTTEIDLLESRITVLDGVIKEQEIILRQATSQNAKLEERLQNLKDEKLPKITEELREREASIAVQYNDAWITEKGAPRYSRELGSRGKADQIAIAFPREQSRARNAKEAAWEALVDLRRSYNDKYKMGYDIKAVGNEVYDDAWIELADNKLPDYQTRINDAKLKAFEQFQEDFISRLQNNISNTKRQIDELNSALKGMPFGEDTYRFKIIPKPEYKRYYEMILNALLDKYERSTFFRNDQQPTRRIMLNFYNYGKSDFPYYDIEQSDRRITINRALIDLEAQHLLFIDWMEQGHIVAKVWLNTGNLSSIYQAAKREPKGEAVDKILLEIEKVQTQINSPWACGFLQDMYDAITRKRGMVSAMPADDEERRLLLQAISAIDNSDGSEYTERLFSLRIFGDTKKFERSVKSRLLSILRKYFDIDDDATDDDILKQVGIVKYPEQFEFCGNISIAFESGYVNFNYLQSGSVIYSSDLSSGRILIDPSIESVITIENRANYIECLRKTKAEKELVIYHGGQYSPRKRKFLQAIANSMPINCKWYHWSDIDYGGFIMLSRLRQEIFQDIIPYRMNSDELERYSNFAATIKTEYAEKLKKLKTRLELSDCYDCIDYMLKNMIRLEQEAMLSDS